MDDIDSRRRFLAGAAATLGMAAFTPAAGAAARSHGGPLPAGRNSVRQHRFGVNYVPSTNWYYCYNDWHLADIRRDMATIAELGMDHLRVMVLWPWFQPNPRRMSEAHLDRLDALMEAAAAVGLDVMPCIFTGWLSGYRFNPNFYDADPFFTAPTWAAAQTLYVKTLAQRMAKHANFLGFDIGNEINCNWSSPRLDENDAWMGRVFAQMHAQAPGKIHVNGVDNQPWFAQHTFSPQALARSQQIVALHCWPFWTGAGERGGPLERPYTHLAASMASLARSYAGAADKPVWVQEFGVCGVEMPEADIPRWMDVAVGAAVRNGVSWFTWWASHDVGKQFDFHPFEYGLGLIGTDHRIKPQGRAFQRLAEQYRGKDVVIPERAIAAPPAARNNASTWQWLLADMQAMPPA
jgi:hypothetical protein